MRRMKNLALLGVWCLAILPALAHAQGTTASMAGTVRDEQNLVVPGATVAITGTENTFSRTVTTGPDGRFELPGLLPGDYKLAVELAGFTREELQVHIEVNQRVRLDLALKAGGVTQRVEVTQT